MDGEAPRQTEVLQADSRFLDRALYAIGIRRLYLEAVEELIRQELEEELVEGPSTLPEPNGR